MSLHKGIQRKRENDILYWYNTSLIWVPFICTQNVVSYIALVLYQFAPYVTCSVLQYMLHYVPEGRMFCPMVDNKSIDFACVKQYHRFPL